MKRVDVYLGLGSNQGDRKKSLAGAREVIIRLMGPIVIQSSIYESEPWGFTSGHRFLNQVIMIQTLLSPIEALSIALDIETRAGRVRDTEKGYQSRTLDIDLLYYDNLVMHTTGLTLPHPQIANRRFVLQPLVEINPEISDPLTGRTCAEMLLLCADTSLVIPYSGP